MSVFDRLRESIFRIRVVPKQTPEDVTSFTDEKNSLTNRMNEAVEAGKRIDLTDLINITSLKGDRNTKYEAFEEMVADAILTGRIKVNDLYIRR